MNNYTNLCGIDPQDLAGIISDTAGMELKEKFIKGQHEHGGDFGEKPTVKNIREEVLDLVNYTHVLISHRAQVLMAMDDLISELASLENSVIGMRLKMIKQMIHDI